MFFVIVEEHRSSHQIGHTRLETEAEAEAGDRKEMSEEVKIFNTESSIGYNNLSTFSLSLSLKRLQSRLQTRSHNFSFTFHKFLILRIDIIWRRIFFFSYMCMCMGHVSHVWLWCDALDTSTDMFLHSSTIFSIYFGEGDDNREVVTTTSNFLTTNGFFFTRMCRSNTIIFSFF